MAATPKPSASPAAEALKDVEQELASLGKLEEITNLNALVLGLSPALAATTVYLSSAFSLSQLYENAVQTQRDQSRLAHASLEVGLAQLRALSAGTAKAADKVIDPDQDVLDMLKALKAAV